MGSTKQESSKLVEDFALGTSCHGLPQVYYCTSKKLKIFWILLVAAVLIIVFWQIGDRFSAYFQYNTSTQVTEVSRTNLQFPSITICNLNRYFNVTGQEREALNTLSSIYDFGNSLNQTQTDKALRFFNQKGSDFNFTEYLLSKTWHLNHNLVLCLIGGDQICSPADFTPIFTSSLGLCWTLRTNVVQTKRGVPHGFHALFDVQQNGYSEQLTFGRSGAGIVVQIHPNFEPAQPQINGLTIGVGSWGSVPIHQHQKLNMYSPWGQCKRDTKNLKHAQVYTVASCYRECSDEYVIRNCSCRDPVVQYFSSVRECSAAEVLNCAAPVRAQFDFDFNPSDCGCHQSCNESKFTAGISYSTYPSLDVANQYRIQGNLTLQYLRENVVGLSVYFDALSITQSVESKATTATALLSDVGGQLGLWIGISVITIFEFLQLFYRLAKIHFLGKIADRFQAYFRYETSTQNTEIYLNNLSFPAISICNLNRYFFVSDEERQALNTLSFIYDYGGANQTRIDQALNFFGQQGDNFNLTQYLISKAWNFSEVVLLCQIGGDESCSPADFFPTFTSRLGLCWTLRTDEVQIKRGGVHGFQILLNLLQDGYSEDIDYGLIGAGIVVQIHAEYEPPQPGINGLTVGAGTWGSISMHQQRRRNMYHPWGQCRPHQKSLLFNPIYSVAACFKECADGLVINSCSCRDPVVQHFSSVRECSAAEVYECAAPARSLIDDAYNPSDCGCYQACNDVLYNTGISYSTFPSLKTAEEYERNANLSLQFLRENSAGVTVYYDRLSYTSSVENKAVSESALLSDIGGQLGLWIGISVVTIFEFLQVLTRLCTNFIRTTNAKQKQNKDKQEENGMDDINQ